MIGIVSSPSRDNDVSSLLALEVSGRITESGSNTPQVNQKAKSRRLPLTPTLSPAGGEGG